VAVVTAALTWWVWGAWAPTPIVADEVAYLLQAGIFADGRVTAPARPLPMFFEQIHVFSSPAVFAKYFPGHPLLLAAGIPLWNHLTLGRWLQSPYEEYSRRYMPAEFFGFGLRGESPAEPLPEDLRAGIRDWEAVHREHTPGALPGILLARADAVARDVWGAWGGRWLGLLVLPGGIGLGATAGVAAAVVLGQFGIFACYAHPWFWTLYYAELFPILCFLSVRGLDQALQLGARRGWYRAAWAAGALAAIGVAVALAQGPAILGVRQAKQAGMQPWRHFQDQLAGVREPRAVVFVRRSPAVSHHISLVRNGPFMDRERIWVAYDRGAENRQLLAAAPDRAPYVYLEDTGMLHRMNR